MMQLPTTPFDFTHSDTFDGTEVFYGDPDRGEYVKGYFDVGDATRSKLNDKSVDFTIGSPPYLEARTYGIGAQKKQREWINDLMMPATREALRVTRGLCVWIIAGQTKGGRYVPGPEALMAEMHAQGINLWRPGCWYKVDPQTGGGSGTPGSAGPQWLRGDWEYAIAFKNPDPLPWADPLFEQRPPKCAPGGNMRNRQPSGRRENNVYKQPKFVNPGNVIKARVGGGHIGDKESHEGDAPYPEKLVEFFIRGWCPPLGWVHDPFSGTGTTVVEALRWCRNGIGFDLRASQIEISMRRLMRRIKEGRQIAIAPWPRPVAA
jgi:DNA modification methylase